MKRIGLILFTLSLFVGCEKDNNNTFDTTVDANSVSFKPIPGGAVMTYNIPESKSIMGINVSYTNSTGEELTVGGSYGATELTIRGFINKEDAVSAKISYVSRDNRKSQPTHMTFSTLAAGAVSIFDNIKVEPYWSGFSVIFDAPENVDGMINIGYMGISPITGKYGVILKETRVIVAGENKLLYNNIVDKEEIIKPVIWTEDLYQKEAKRESYEVMPKMTKMADPSKLVYTGDSFESGKIFSVAYLFDGDNKGLNGFYNKNGGYIFATESDVSIKPEGTIDLGEPQTLAFFRYYAPLNNNIRTPSGLIDGAFPNHFKLYAGNNKDADLESGEWIEMGEYYQSKSLDDIFWWCYPQFDPSRNYKIIEDIEAANPCFVDVNFDVSETKYRYLKIQFLSVFVERATSKRAQCSEMEVYIEK